MSATKTQRIILRSYGGPEVLTSVSEEMPALAAGDVRIRQTAVGFNFIDIYQRRGAGQLPLPTGLGFEAAGEIEAIGSGVSQFRPGDRVAYMNTGVGAYADRRDVSADRLVHLPDFISNEVAATLFFKGMTAQYLLRRTHVVRAGEVLLVHSAAGGVGQILTRWATALGAIVIGTTSSPSKREAARAAGCVAVVDTNDPNWPTAFLEAAQGRKADVVYDAVGRATLLKSLECAAPFGLVVCYGAASGPAPAIDPELLNRNGCLFLTRPSVFPHNADPATFRTNAADLFAAIEKGHAAVEIGARFPLLKVAEAHRMAENRGVHGAIVLEP